MRREGRMPVAAMDRMSCMRREGKMPVAAQTRLYQLHPCKGVVRTHLARSEKSWMDLFSASLDSGAARPYAARRL